MSIPVTLNSTDSGAPSLSNTVGSLYNVLNWALPQLGWSIVTDTPSAHTIIFRNSAVTGTGNYLKIYDDGALGSVSGQKAGVSMGTTSSANDAPTTGQSSTGYNEFFKSENSSAVTWQIIGDERTFVFKSLPFSGYSGANFQSTMYFGDINSYVPGDAYAFVIMTLVPHSLAFGDSSEASYPGQWYGVYLNTVTFLSTTTPYTYSKDYNTNLILKNASGSSASVNFGVYTRPSRAGGISLITGQPDSSTNRLFFEVPQISESGYLRGSFRGLYWSLNSLSSYANSTAITPYTFNGLLPGSVAKMASAWSPWQGFGSTNYNVHLLVETALAW